MDGIKERVEDSGSVEFVAAVVVSNSVVDEFEVVVSREDSCEGGGRPVDVSPSGWYVVSDADELEAVNPVGGVDVGAAAADSEAAVAS